MNQDKQAYTVEDLVERWQITRNYLYIMVRAGRIKAFRIGSAIRVTAEEVARIESGEGVK